MKTSSLLCLALVTVASFFATSAAEHNALGATNAGTNLPLEDPEEPNTCVYDEPSLENLDAGLTLVRGTDSPTGVDEVTVKNYYAKKTMYEGLNFTLAITNGPLGREDGDGVTPGQEWNGYQEYQFNVSRTKTSPKFFRNQYKFAFAVHRANTDGVEYWHIDEKDVKANVGFCKSMDSDTFNRAENPLAYITVHRYLPTGEANKKDDALSKQKIEGATKKDESDSKGTAARALSDACEAGEL
ncbi:hypothetical protein CBS101457_000703 [Exobasidium rhododendri]|nr:hypothetical protein CBS101457_000703 [Exobasidium rhododendri]